MSKVNLNYILNILFDWMEFCIELKSVVFTYDNLLTWTASIFSLPTIEPFITVLTFNITRMKILSNRWKNKKIPVHQIRNNALDNVSTRFLFPTFSTSYTFIYTVQRVLKISSKVRKLYKCSLIRNNTSKIWTHYSK